MRNEIELYVEELFKNAPRNTRTRELKEEILSNSLDRYNDLVSAGIDEDDAYDSVIGNIGSVNELIVDYNVYDEKEHEERKKSAKVTAIAVVLYILSPLMVIICDEFDLNEVVGISFLFIFIAIATGMLVYNNMSKIKKYDKEDDSIVEEIIEKKTGSYNKKKIKRSISSAVWAVAISMYFIVSFWSMAWNVSWVIFIIGYAVNQIIEAMMDLKEERA